MVSVRSLPLTGPLLIELTRYEDPRGSFCETWNAQDSAYFDLPVWVQENSSTSGQGVLRGLHFQRTPGQAKLVRCSSGCIWDCMVDLRSESPTCGQWCAVELDAHQPQWLYIPAGFAHGFCVLSDQAIVDYKVSQRYNPAEERTLRWDDPSLQIAWPIQQPLLSERDRLAPGWHQVREELVCG